MRVRWLLAGLGLVLLVAVQAVLAVHLAVAGTVPDLPLAAALVLGLQGGPRRGGLAGVVVGLSMDLLRGSQLGLFALAAGIAGWLCGEAAARVDAGRAMVRWIIASVAAALYGAVVVVLWRVLGHPVHLHGALHHILGAALYDGLLAALAYWPLAAMGRRAFAHAKRYPRMGIGRP